jgi:hypothetical protein
VVSATGEVNADLDRTGSNDGISWIDLFARGDIAINGAPAPCLSGSPGPGASRFLDVALPRIQSGHAIDRED